MFEGRKKSNRLEGYDYSLSGCYFVTVRVKGGEEWFGNVVDEKMILNKYGFVANQFWREIPKHYENVGIDKWIVMPDHLHGIVIIRDSIKGVGTGHCPVPDVAEAVRNTDYSVMETKHHSIQSFGKIPGMKHNSIRSVMKTKHYPIRSSENVVGTRQRSVLNVAGTKNGKVRNVVGTGRCPVPTTTGRNYGLLSKVVGAFKSMVTRIVREKFGDYDFSWQRSFHDRIIRAKDEFYKIRQYIKNNPRNWKSIL